MQLLSGTLAVPNTTIQSAPYNAQQNDWVLDANNPRPISAGGTGATTATAARTALGALGTGDLAAAPTKAVVVDTDSIVMIDSQASNAKKRWLVSAMKTTFGPTGHNHTKLVSTVADISINLTGSPGTGVWNFNNKANGTGQNMAYITDAGYMSIGQLDVASSITAATITTTSTITAGTSVYVKGGSNIHYWFFSPTGEDRGVIFTNGGGANDLFIRNAADKTFTFDTAGYFKSPSRVYAGAAYLNTDGNLSGTAWSAWGTTSAFSAISDRIESRAAAFADDRVGNMQYRKTGGGTSGTAQDWAAPAGAVVTGYHREGGATGQVSSLIYMYLQVYDQQRGWVGFTG
jgi:hypothetical protein